MSLEDICAKKDEAIDKQKATEALREEAEARYETQVQRVAKLEAEVAELQQSAASVREDKARMSTELDVSRQAAREVKLEMESLMSNLAQQRASNLEVPRGHCQVCLVCLHSKVADRLRVWDAPGDWQVGRENRNLLVEVRSLEERNMALVQMVHTEEDARKRL